MPSSPTDLRANERRTIEQVLRETSWNKREAARQLGLTPAQLSARLRKYDLDGLQPGDRRPARGRPRQRNRFPISSEDSSGVIERELQADSIASLTQ